MSTVNNAQLLEAAKQHLKDASRFILFDDKGAILGASFEVCLKKPRALNLFDTRLLTRRRCSAR